MVIFWPPGYFCSVKTAAGSHFALHPTPLILLGSLNLHVGDPPLSMGCLVLVLFFPDDHFLHPSLPLLNHTSNLITFLKLPHLPRHLFQHPTLWPPAQGQSLNQFFGDTETPAHHPSSGFSSLHPVESQWILIRLTPLQKSSISFPLSLAPHCPNKTLALDELLHLHQDSQASLEKTTTRWMGAL